VWIAVDKQWIRPISTWITSFFALHYRKTYLYMSAAGYSGTPLVRKLGIKPAWKLRLIGAPAEYFGWLEEDLSGALCPPRAIPDFVHLFAVTRRKPDARPSQRGASSPAGGAGDGRVSGDMWEKYCRRHLGVVVQEVVG
jgi:hypothetical protein